MNCDLSVSKYRSSHHAKLTRQTISRRYLQVHRSRVCCKAYFDCTSIVLCSSYLWWRRQPAPWCLLDDTRLARKFRFPTSDSTWKSRFWAFESFFENYSYVGFGVAMSALLVSPSCFVKGIISVQCWPVITPASFDENFKLMHSSKFPKSKLLPTNIPDGKFPHASRILRAHTSWRSRPSWKCLNWWLHRKTGDSGLNLMSNLVPKVFKFSLLKLKTSTSPGDCSRHRTKVKQTATAKRLLVIILNSTWLRV